MALNRRLFMLILVVLGLCACVGEVPAFSADVLAISIQPSGDADITFGYTLTWLERAGVLFNIADPAREMASIMEGQYHRPVTVHEVRPDAMSLTVPGFATVAAVPGGTLYQTPSMDFRSAEQVLHQYWFAPLVSPDFSPRITTVTFPDGQGTSWYDEGVIPAIEHLVQ
jgi:hypothetical protein